MPLMGPQRTILFLIADTGAGHRSAANAIRNAMTFLTQKRQEEWLIQQQTGTEEQKSVPAQVAYSIEIVDGFEEHSRLPLRDGMKLIELAICYSQTHHGRLDDLSLHAQMVPAMKSFSL